MTTTFPTSADAARAADLDAAHVAWSALPITSRGTFGAFAVIHLRERGLELNFAPEPMPCCAGVLAGGDHAPYCPADKHEDEPVEASPVPTGTQLAELLGLFPSPYIEQALAMGVEAVADLLAALAEWGLSWIPGDGDQCGTLIEGPREPDDLHVTFDAFHGAWQRDDDRAHENADPARRWFGPNGARSTWAELLHGCGPMTPEGGIAPTSPRGDLL